MTTLLTQLALSLLLFAPEEQAEYVEIITNLEVAIDNFAEGDRQASIMRLEGLLDQLTRFPGHSPDDNLVPEVSLRARIALVRLYLAEGDDESAAMMMDEAIRSARDQELPVRAYGPHPFRLYQERSNAIERVGTGTILVNCAPDPGCEIVINERLLPHGENSEKLPLGDYRVWVRVSDDEAPWQSYSVELDTAETIQTIEFEAPESSEDPEQEDTTVPTSSDTVPTSSSEEQEDTTTTVPTGSTSGVSANTISVPRQTDTPQKQGRMLPWQADLAGALVGVGLLVTGGVLLSFHGKCSESGERVTAETAPETTAEECGNIYNSIPAGAALLGIGGGLLVVSGVMFAIDEVRVGKATGRQVTVGVSLRF